MAAAGGGGCVGFGDDVAVGVGGDVGDCVVVGCGVDGGCDGGGVDVGDGVIGGFCVVGDDFCGVAADEVAGAAPGPP